MPKALSGIQTDTQSMKDMFSPINPNFTSPKDTENQDLLFAHEALACPNENESLTSFMVHQH
jgi:hypothetical protein